ncbi:MAG: hypothetical protein HY080_16080 [Gammaproteobacteria bacterium]|nr:hypothetical protein [Gammaproteobacteria bacterium]
MVTQEAKNSLETLLQKCLDDTLKTVAHKNWNIRKLDKFNADMPAQFVMLTISSYAFRIFMLLHFSKNTSTTAYVARALKLDVDKIGESRYYDYLGEMGNTFVGGFKRDLGIYFPHLGMSTPNRLAAASMQFLSEMKFDYSSHFKASHGEDLNFIGSIYVSAYRDLNFRVEKIHKTQSEAEIGALELF